MKTIALRFSDNFAPPEGTIEEHRKCICERGFVWYGKLGGPVSDKVCKELMENKNPRILLIHSGKSYRYWAYINKIIKKTPLLKEIPYYYRDRAELFNTWFCVRKIEATEKDVMSRCIVVSSGAPLTMSSRSSMSPYFIIEYEEGDDV